MNSFFSFVKNLMPILQEIIKKGGKPYLVGGSVRDLILGIEIKDVDIEVHKISLQELENCLKKFGVVKLVGKKFGVLRVFPFDVDWSLPRKDTKGRKPIVEIDPNMTIEAACRRRDLTMNAMAIDLSEIMDRSIRPFRLRQGFDGQVDVAQGERALGKSTVRPERASLETSRTGTNGNQPQIIDPYNGQQDIKDKTLRAVDQTLFLDDPLRFFRVMQFIGRFEMFPDNALNTLCRKMDLCDVTTGSPVAHERIYDEIKKLILKSKRPSLGFRWLKEIERLKEIFPELYALVGVPQNSNFHPEGDVFEHTMQALDAGAALDFYENDEEKFTLILGVLCHDLGKAVATEPDLTCKKHSEMGFPLARALMKRFCEDKTLIDSIGKLVKFHTRPLGLLRQKSSIKAYKRLALQLAPHLTLKQLMIVNLADVQGRNAYGPTPLPKESFMEEFNAFMKNIKQANIEFGPEKPVLLGRHLLDVIAPGPKMGKLLKKAYKIQIDESIKDLDELKRRVLEKD